MMMKRTLLAMSIPAVLMAGSVNAAEIYNKDGNRLDLYGKVVGERGWTFSNNKGDNADSSYMRLGIKGRTQISSQLIGYGQWESQMKASGNAATNTRLAFVGFDFGPYGTLDYGRKHGIAYDAAAATDQFVGWGNDGWNSTDNFMTARGNSMLTYRNKDFFGAVKGLTVALQFQGKNNYSQSSKGANGEGFGTSISYTLPIDLTLTAAYANSNRTPTQKPGVDGDGVGNKAETAGISIAYDANHIYAALMYAQTNNAVPLPGKLAGNKFANKTQNFEAFLQYQFDFGLSPSIGYLESKADDLAANGNFKGGKADLLKYVEAGAKYTFNKNMNIYAAYQFNLLKKDDIYNVTYTNSTDDQMVLGVTYQF